jgi:hypothetical protein
MATVTGSNTISLNLSQTLAYGVGQSTTLSAPIIIRSVFNASGNALNQCDLLYCTTLTFAASTPQSLNLASLLDIFGGTVDFARIRLLAIRNNSTVDGAILQVGASGTHDWPGLTSSAATATVNVYPSAAGSPANDGFTVFQMPNTTGALVTSTTNILKLDPGANAFTADILIAGCVA